MTAKKEMH